MYSSKSWKMISSNLFRWMFVWISIKMLEYDRIDISEGIDVDKTNPSKFVIIGTLKILILNMRCFFVMVIMA